MEHMDDTAQINMKDTKVSHCFTSEQHGHRSVIRVDEKQEHYYANFLKRYSIDSGINCRKLWTNKQIHMVLDNLKMKNYPKNVS